MIRLLPLWAEATRLKPAGPLTERITVIARRVSAAISATSSGVASV